MIDRRQGVIYMPKRSIGMLVLLSILLAIPVCADMRATTVYSDITFANRKATCSVGICADRLTDTISATMELWEGTVKIMEWSDSGTFDLSTEETVTAQ